MPDIKEIPLLYTVIALTAGCGIYIMQMKTRLKGTKAVLLNILFFILFAVLLIFTKNKNPRFGMLYLLAAIILLFLYIWILGNTKPVTAAYCCIRGFILGEFAASAEWLAYVWFARETGIYSPVWSVIFMMVIYGVLYGSACYLEHLVQYDYEMAPVKLRDLVYTFAFAYAGFYLGNSVKIPDADGQAISLVFYNTRALMAFGSVALLYAFHAVRREMYMKQENDTLQYLMQSRYEQYQQSKESAELINMKYHDLKHQIQFLKEENNSEKRMKSLEKLEADICQQETKVDSGNEVLDTILSEKKRYCLAHEISLTAVADGSRLDFMDMMDLCSIFGNALDNAIECLEKCEEKEKRVIHFLVAPQKKFLLIKVENYCEEEPELLDGLPKTTKDNTDFHGFGMRSMKYIVEKYDGMLTCGVQNHWFELKILIPVKE